jgi:MGT family glycosyltransferase
VFPQLAIAHALRSSGHECAFYSGAQVAPLIEGEGFRLFPFSRLDERALAALMRGRPAEPWRVTNLRRLASLLRAWLLDTIPQQVADLEEIAREWPPDVIATDFTMWGPILVLRDKHGARVAVCSTIPACPVPGAGVPPFGPGLPLPRRWTQSLAVAMARLSLRRSSAMATRLANAIRREHALPPISVPPAEYAARMPLYLIPGSREFDYNRQDLPASVHYVGPYLWNRPRGEQTSAWIDSLRADLPCVHVTEGTFHVHRPIVLEAALSGLAGLPMQVVITTGGRSVDSLQLPPPASNIRVERWVSHSDLLPRTHVMVTTGGAGSVLASLAAGVPLVIVPTEWDKPEMAQRVVEAGAGIRLDPRRCTAERMRDSVLRVLREPSFAANAKRLASTFAQAGGASRAAELLVGLSARR